tara:strand:- start:394 stop:585 length:192 start_codon:yes stop_codon:yes gene_type:complete
MKKITYLITEGTETYGMEFVTDRSKEWTEEQYKRHRLDCTMVFISEKETNETIPTTTKVGTLL